MAWIHCCIHRLGLSRTLPHTNLFKAPIVNYSYLVIYGVILLNLVITNVHGSREDSFILSSFTDSTNTGEFNHMKVDTRTGLVYVGAVNRLYQLSNTLTKEVEVVTGPKLNSLNCPPTEECQCNGEFCSDYEKKLTDSVNKALLIDYENQLLLSCTNVFQGHCEKRQLANITLAEESLFIPVVPFDIKSSVVMLIAPGPANSDREPQPYVLYVGATRSSVGLKAYQDLIPAVCSRKLSDFSFVYEEVSAVSKKEVEGQHKDTFKINYTYAFDSGGFTYFLAVQKESTRSKEYGSRIIRVCQNDKYYYSYVEIPLECEYQGEKYTILETAYTTMPGSNLAASLGLAHIPPFSHSDHVLFTVFSKATPGSPDKGSANSAICVYPLRTIRHDFTKTVQDCFKGIGNTGPAHMVQQMTCQNVDNKKFPIDDNYCGEYDLNHPISGNSPIKSEAVMTFTNTSITSILVNVTYNYTVAFLGTDNGYIKKVVLESSTNATEYANLPIDPGTGVIKDLALDSQKQHLYAVSSSKVVRIKLHNCSVYDSCATCLGANDPYCGWCSLANKCSPLDQCETSPIAKWLAYSGSQCTKIKQVIPHEIQIQKKERTNLVIKVLNLPPSQNGNYQCSFIGYGVVRNTTAVIQVIENELSELTCDTPEYNLLPPLPTREDHIKMQLAVRMAGKDVVSDSVTFFNCAVHTSCTSCTNSNYPCTWCVKAHTCVYNRETCSSDVLITGQNVPGDTDTPGPEMCPRFEIDEGYNKILVPAMTQVAVKVKAINLQDFQGEFKCEFQVDTGDEVLNARRVEDDYIKCDLVEFDYKNNRTPYFNVPFKVTWGSQEIKALDNPKEIQVEVYKCTAMASNCGECLTLPPRYLCGWCNGECSIASKCSSPNVWLNRTDICPNPTISSFTPLTGPVRGGTEVTIKGKNLGKAYSDIEDGVTIGDVPCDPIEDQYIPAVQIVCKTSDRDDPSEGTIKVVVNNNPSYSGSSLDKFAFVVPVIDSFTPAKGPQSGGTRVTLYGQNLDTGSNIQATITKLKCVVMSRTPTQIICVTTSRSDDSNDSGKITVQFDDHRVKSPSKFAYTDDPEIFSVEPEKSILGGGTRVVVTGENLDAIQKPQMVVHYKQNEYISQDCELDQNDSSLICLTPSLNPKGENNIMVDPEKPLMLPYGFIMDNVFPLRNLTAHTNGERYLFVYPDPDFEEFEDGTKLYSAKTEYLTINGKYLNHAMKKDDIRVLIGESPCQVTSVSMTQLTCTPPKPADKSNSDGDLVVVYIGNNMTFTIGKLKYEGEDGIISMPFIIAIASAGGACLFIIIGIIIWYRTKNRENERKMKKIQTQRDQLEARVAKECKAAFAELQTDMTELCAEVQNSTTGIPFRSYRSFAMKVLFPNENEEEHPVTRPSEPELEIDNVRKGLYQFNQLIGNKTFLLLFIRTLEQNPDFHMREKVKVASLISVALQNRMEYHTEVLKTLLKDLIEKTMESGNYPHLLMRRTESMAEKMLTNWFTFLLYKFLKECAGQPLFTLFCAIKGQIDKGPVDSLTSEAKYSLHEDKLIRQEIEYKTITIQVIDPDTPYGAQHHPVKVLDCNTISQVKEKILDALYKNAPYSQRPDKNDLDLEWREGSRGKVLLHDEDQTTRQEGDHKRINTLEHYNVHDRSIMALVPKPSSLYNNSLGSDRSGYGRYEPNGRTLTKDMYAGGSPPNSRSLSPNQVHIDIDGAKRYHLVKSAESDTHREGDRGSKMVLEIYLNRLLITKGALQQFMDDLFESIFSVAIRGYRLPLAIKYLFDFLDDQALDHCIQEPNVVHIWKSNSLPLRFWVNIIKNPDFVFDIHKSNIVDSCLSVVGQTFMDSCSTGNQTLGKDSPSTKLLYAKEMNKYKKWVEKYYQEVKQMPAISDQEMNDMLAEESKSHRDEFNLDAALYMLYEYVEKYKEDLLQSLEEDEFARNYRLPYLLDQVIQMMSATDV